MNRDVAVTFENQIEELTREIAMRQKLYPQWIQQERLTPPDAAVKLARLKATLETLKALQQYRNAVPRPFFSMRYITVDL